MSQDLRIACIENAETKNDNWLADIPVPGFEIKKSDPVTSVLARGSCREEVLSKLMARTAALENFIKFQ